MCRRVWKDYSLISIIQSVVYVVLELQRDLGTTIPDWTDDIVRKLIVKSFTIILLRKTDELGIYKPTLITIRHVSKANKNSRY